MELLEVIRTRRSARAYADEPVSIDIIAQLLDLAANAPTACNRQNWRCILVQERATLDWLYRQGGSTVLKNCSQAILVCYEAETENSEWHDNIQSAAAFIAYFQLIAHERGIGSCWLCHLPPKQEVSDYFIIPPQFMPVAVVTYGYYVSDRSLAPRKNGFAKILCHEKWSFADRDNYHSGGVSIMRKYLRTIYYSLPFRYLLRPLASRYEKKFDD